MKIIGKLDAKQQGLKYYYTGKSCKHGHLSKRYVCNGHCYECHKGDADNRYQTKKDVYLKNSNDYYKSNKDKYRKQRQSYYQKNKETILKRNKKWKDSNKPKRAHDRALYRANLKNATPKWANLKAIEEIYKNCPKGYHVDHDIPLGSKIICGLHVENNLKYLPAKENMSKHCHFKAYIELSGCHDERRYLDKFA
jgi:hypothetical protein